MIQTQSSKAHLPTRSNPLPTHVMAVNARALEVVLFAAGMDACLSEAEVTALSRAQGDEPHFQEVAKQQLRRLAFGSQVDRPLEAIHWQLEELASIPVSFEQRREAWLLAVRFAHAIGRDVLQDLVLSLMRERFGLPEETLPLDGTNGGDE